MRNRFTIDTDIVFDGEPDQDLASPQEPDPKQPCEDEQHQEQQSELAGDTDRWVEEQFDLEEYEDPEEVKETDILSDDDEFCQTPKGRSAGVELEAPVMALSLEGEETEGDEDTKSPTASETANAAKLSDTGKQCAVTEEGAEDQRQTEEEEIWVRRERSDGPPDCDT